MPTPQTIPSYTTERDIRQGAIFLDANEGYRQWVQIYYDSLPDINRYPDDDCRDLREIISSSYAKPFDPSQILVSCGSMELIDIILRALCKKGLLLNDPTYQVYDVKARQLGLKVERVTLNRDYTLDMPGLRRAASQTDVLLLINPNNPTGSLVSATELEEILSFYEGHIIIDEAYIEFAGLASSLEKYALTHPNVIIMRSFSKAWGLAGIRLGYALGNKMVLDKLSAYKNTYSVSAIAQDVGIQALAQQDGLHCYVKECLEYKRQLLRRLRNRGIDATDSSANFILIRTPDSHTLHQHLRDNNILVRHRGHQPLMENTIRITVGNRDENEKLVRLIEEFMGA